MIGGLIRWLWNWGDGGAPTNGACAHITGISSPTGVVVLTSPSSTMTIASTTTTISIEEC